MTECPELTTPRLRLRQWRDSDLEAFAALNADPQVMKYMPALLDRAASDALAAGIRVKLAEQGFGQWAVEVPGVADFIGIVGLAVPRFRAHFTPCVEIEWRLAHAHWGRGYASEAAAAVADFAFGPAGLPEIVAFTVPANRRSRRVMERLGTSHSLADDFDHPGLPAGHPLRRHALYRLTRAAWLAR